MKPSDTPLKSTRLRSWMISGVGLVGVLVLFGKARFPNASLLGVAATLSVLSLYGVAGWFGSRILSRQKEPFARMVISTGLLAGGIFASEIGLEYVFLPTDNTGFGWVEFGLVFAVYFGVGALVAYRQFPFRWSVAAGAATAVISSLIWYLGVLACFYAFFGTERQARVFRAEGNYEDFKSSGTTDFNTFVMDDFLGAGFFHLLLGPIVASLLASLGGLVGIAMGWFWKMRRVQQ